MAITPVLKGGLIKGFVNIQNSGGGSPVTELDMDYSSDVTIENDFVIPFSDASFSDSFFEVQDNTKLVVKKAGSYLINASVPFFPEGTGQRLVFLGKNGEYPTTMMEANTAIEFSALNTDARVYWSTVNEFSLTGFTVECWFKMTSAPSSENFMSNSSTSARMDNVFMFFAPYADITNTATMMAVAVNSAMRPGLAHRSRTNASFHYSSVSGNTTLTTNKWYHFMLTHSRTGLDDVVDELFIDGSKAVSLVTNNGIDIGGDRLVIKGSEKNFKYAIDDIRLSNIVRNTDYSFDPPTQAYTADGNTLGLWRMNDRALGTYNFASDDAQVLLVGDEDLDPVAGVHSFEFSDSSGNNNHLVATSSINFDGGTWPEFKSVPPAPVGGGGSKRYGEQIYESSADSPTTASVNTTMELAEGDYIELVAWQNSGMNLPVFYNGVGPNIAIKKL